MRVHDMYSHFNFSEFISGNVDFGERAKEKEMHETSLRRLGLRFLFFYYYFTFYFVFFLSRFTFSIFFTHTRPRSAVCNRFG